MLCNIVTERCPCPATSVGGGSRVLMNEAQPKHAIRCDTPRCTLEIFVTQSHATRSTGKQIYCHFNKNSCYRKSKHTNGKLTMLWKWLSKPFLQFASRMRATRFRRKWETRAGMMLMPKSLCCMSSSCGRQKWCSSRMNVRLLHFAPLRASPSLIFAVMTWPSSEPTYFFLRSGWGTGLGAWIFGAGAGLLGFGGLPLGERSARGWWGPFPGPGWPGSSAAACWQTWKSG